MIDENLPPALAQIAQLMASDDPTITVRNVEDFAGRGTEDPALFRKLGEAGGILVTRDLRQHRRPQEIAEIRSQRIGVYRMHGKNLGMWDLTRQLVLAWPEILRTARSTRRPFIMRVKAKGGLQPEAI